MIDLAILAVFVLASVAAGLRMRRKASRNLEEFFLAGRTLRGWQAGTSMAATQFAADTPLVVTGLVATAGIYALWQLWVYGVAFLLLAFVFASHWQRAGVLTDAELVELRYGGRGVLALRAIKAIYYGTVMNCVVLAMVLKATVTMTEVFLPWHEWLPAPVHHSIVRLVGATGVVVASGLTGIDPVVASANNFLSVAAILAFVALYSMTGGLRSVVFTDVFQFALALAGTFIYAGVAVAAAGGLGGLVQRVAETCGSQRASSLLGFAPSAEAAMGPFLVIVSLQSIFQVNSDGTGYLAQRSMSCRNEREARAAAVLFAWLQILLRSLPWLLIAVALLVVYPFGTFDTEHASFRAAREFAFIAGIEDLLPSGARGLLLVGMLGALASTLDTHLNWGASYWANDIYRRLLCGAWLRREPGARELVLVGRLSNVLLIGFALALVPALDSIQQAWKISLLFGAGAGSVLVLRWLWERINLWSELAAMAVSLALAPILLAFAGGADQEWLRLAVMAAASTAAAIGVTWLTPANRDETLLVFYRRVRPVGVWPRASALAGDARRVPLARLGAESLTTALCAASLFACLYGAARLLLPHPERSPWVPAVTLAAGAALVPLWWRRAFRTRP